MPSFTRLLSPKSEFFDIFRESADLIVDGAKTFRTMLDDTNSFQSKSQHIKNVEHKADELTHRTYELLHKTFITPFDREDIQQLISRMDDIMDFIDAAAQRTHLYGIGKPQPAMTGLADLCVRAAELVKQAVQGLEDLKKPREIMHTCIEINRIENEADNLLRTAVAELFKNESDVKQLIKLKEIYELMETVTDRCEDVANIIDGLILEYS